MREPLPLLLLPGMHGTAALFAPFAEQLAPELAPRLVSYGADLGRSYAAYLDAIELPDGPFGIVAESFSGPIGILLAAKHADRVRGLVLAATFIRAPSLARLATRLPTRLFDAPPPAFALRAALLGAGADAETVARLTTVLRDVPPGLIAERLRLVGSVDVTRAFTDVRAPVLYIEAASDRLLSRTCAREILEACPGCVHHVIDAPHLVLQHSPERAAALVSEHFCA